MVIADLISEAALKDDFSQRLDRYFAEASGMTPEAWAEGVRRMEGGRRYSFDYAPYQREPFLEVFNPENQVTVLAMFSRGGKTEIVANALGYSIDQEPRRIIVGYPSQEQAEDFSKDNFMTQLVEPTPALAELLPSGEGRRIANQTIRSKSFPGGKADFAGLNVAGKLRKLKGDFLYGDEIDSITEEASDEGDKIEILFKRGEEFPDPIKVLTSYPSLKGRSKIWTWLERSDWRQWTVGCACGHEYVLHRNQMRWPKGEPEKALLFCPVCDKSITDKQRVQMVRAGEWRGTRPYKGIRGYQANGMLWPHPHQRAFKSFLHQVAERVEAIERAENPERTRRVLINTFDAEPYETATEEKPEGNKIHQRREVYDPYQELPRGVLFLVAGVDVQKTWLEIEIVGFGANDETWGICHKKLPGHWAKSSTWAKLDRIRTKEWNHPILGPMKPVVVCVDSGNWQDKVLGYTRTRAGQGVHGVKGAVSLAKPLVGKPSMVGRPPAKQFQIGTNEAKDIIYQRLALEKGEEEVGFPQGWMHFPKNEDYDSEYFDGLLVESSTMAKGPDGQWYPRFECPKGARNEPLDLRVYAMAAARILRPNFKKLQARLEESEEASFEERSEAAKVKKPRRRRRGGMGGGWALS